ncbi:hypothetical protein GO730_16620 [Spirosoma sp. HMF3257]|uniref:Uncharacterized protein n=1 Tax=Spirosoma telluris TaxID=2183553 RepID=A0A327NJ59_9BACT|nr:hypothetical protein [Spirosoma telluris]RAI75380.1 hypothetical protein HMF3257_16555 [Spirosoma telluris]
MENSNSSALSDGAQQANLVSNENAEAMFGADQGETNMVKLVDGKLTPIGDTEDDVVDGQLANRYSSDEERSLQGDQLRGKTYENSDSALYADAGIDDEAIPHEPNTTSTIAEADLTGNPDAGSTVATGLPSEDEPSTPTNSFGSWNVIGSNNGLGNYPSGDMIPSTPGSPNPIQPVPGIPETPPTPPVPGPEIPEMPGTPKPDVPEVQDPSEPDRSHEINAHGLSTFTSAAPGVVATNGPKPDGHVAKTKYEGLPEAAKAVPGTEEGMEDKPDTGDSARPYDVNAKDRAENQPGERPEEAKEAQKFPREMADESSIAAQDMISGTDRSDQKSTEGLDRKYNDPEAAREMAS